MEKKRWRKLSAKGGVEKKPVKEGNRKFASTKIGGPNDTKTPVIRGEKNRGGKENSEQVWEKTKKKTEGGGEREKDLSGPEKKKMKWGNEEIPLQVRQEGGYSRQTKTKDKRRVNQ